MNDDSVTAQAGADGASGPLEPGYYPDPMGYFQLRFYDPIHGWSAPCIHNGRRIQDPLADVSKSPPPTTSPTVGSHELTETREKPATVGNDRVVDSPPLPDLYQLPAASDGVGNDTPDGGPTMRVVGQSWIRWNGEAWADYSTGEPVPDPPEHGYVQVLESAEQHRRRPLLGHTARNLVVALLSLCVLAAAGLAVLVSPLPEKIRSLLSIEADGAASAAPLPTSTRARPLRDCASVPKRPGADLHNCRLANASFLSADLKGVNFSGADLSGASIWLSNLATANLSNANLTAANLTGVDLTGANMSGANLTDAFLNHADLSDANLLDAICHHTTWTNGEIILVGPKCPSRGR